eukprot:3253417-Lingulodinium_polyedra.AAC.1
MPDPARDEPRRTRPTELRASQQGMVLIRSLMQHSCQQRAPIRGLLEGLLEREPFPLAEPPCTRDRRASLQ